MEVLFTFFAERYERRSLLISSNLDSAATSRSEQKSASLRGIAMA